MNRWQKEVQASLLKSEAAAIAALKKQYEQALRDIGEKIKLFQADIDLLDEALSQEGLDDQTRAMLESRKKSKVYQKQYQMALKSQVGSILDKMQGDNYATIDKYLKGCYEDGFIGTMYDIAKQGIPLVLPIDQAAAVKAILTDSKIAQGYYNRLGLDVAKLKKTITQEISRGIASGLSYNDIARNINNVSKSGLYNAQRITRTEGHRIQQSSTRNAQYAAKAKGADVVKQWDAAMQECTFLLTGFSRGSWLALEDAKERIESYFDKVDGKTVMAENGSAVAIFYANALIVPTGDAELKRIQINLSCKEWSVK